MIILYILLWVVWLIPMIMYIIWKREDWYLFVIPPIVLQMVMMALSIVSDVLSVSVCIVIHVLLLGAYYYRKIKL